MKFFSKRTLIIGGIIVAVLIVIFVIRRRGATPALETVTVTRGDVIQDVTISGRVEPVEKYDLSFAASGIVKTLAVKEGDTVVAGQTLGTLEVADVAMQQAQANATLLGDQQTATLAVEQAKQTLTETARVNDIKIAEAKEKVRNAKIKLDIAKEQFNRIKSENGDETAAAYLSAESAYTAALANYTELQEALQVLTAGSQQTEKLAAADVATAEQSLKLKQDTINGSGTLSANRAAVGYQGAVLGKSILRAPAAGIVSSIALQIGEYASPASSVISVSTPELHITANVPEADIAKLAVNDRTTVTLDAYGEGVTFEATIATIDQVETLVDGVPTYQATFNFVAADDRVKSGMTANTTVHADKREQVLVIPQRAVITRNGDTFVRLAEGDTFREVEVATGLRGSDGTVEVTAGLAEGNRVVIFVAEK